MGWSVSGWVAERKSGLGERRTRTEDTGRRALWRTRKSSPHRQARVFSGGKGGFDSSLHLFRHLSGTLLVSRDPEKQGSWPTGQHQGTQWMRVVVCTAGKKAGEAGRAAAPLPAHTKVANSPSSQVMVHGSSLGPWQRRGLAPFPWHLWRACHA